jgi:hypothetical protein
MKVVKNAVSLKTAVLLFAGIAVLGMPAAAQQEVSPDHFDDKPAAAQSHKPAPQASKAASAKTKNTASNHRSADPKSKPASQPSSTLKAEAAGQTGANPR